MPPAPCSAAVIGGGIVGLSTALALQARGLDVILFDAPGTQAPASAGNAGHIALEQHDPLASWATLRSLPGRLMSRGGPASFPPGAVRHWLPFGLRLLGAARPTRFARGQRALGTVLAQALPAWRRVMTQIEAPDLLREEGHIVAWEGTEAARHGRAALAGFTSPLVRWRDLSGDEMRLLGDQLRAPPADAVRFDGTASVADPAAVLEALRIAFQRRGGTLEVRTTTLGAAQRMAEITVVAAGVRSTAPMRELGVRVPLIAERGYHIQSPESRWPATLPPVVFEDRSMVVTRFRSGLRATSFVEFTHPDAPADDRKWAQLKSHATALGLPFDAAPRSWLGARPTLPDYLPAIGRSARDPRVLYAFGHNHLGLTLGPFTGELVATLACEDRASIDMTPFAVERFG